MRICHNNAILPFQTNSTSHIDISNSLRGITISSTSASEWAHEDERLLLWLLTGVLSEPRRPFRPPARLQLIRLVSDAIRRLALPAARRSRLGGRIVRISERREVSSCTLVLRWLTRVFVHSNEYILYIRHEEYAWKWRKSYFLQYEYISIYSCVYVYVQINYLSGEFEDINHSQVNHKLSIVTWWAFDVAYLLNLW